jgi:hypothetical protein
MTTQLSMTTPDPLASEIEWTQQYPDAWRCIVEWAHDDRAHGYSPSTRLYACVLRRPHMAARLGLTRAPGSPVLLNDHLTAGLARLLNRRFPDLMVPTREAMVDKWAGVEGAA